MSAGIVHKHTAFCAICWISSVIHLFYKVLSIAEVIQHWMEYTMATVNNNKLGECGQKQWRFTLRHHHGSLLQKLRKITEKVPSLDLNLMPLKRYMSHQCQTVCQFEQLAHWCTYSHWGLGNWSMLQVLHTSKC
jgi:hypothetical protein